MSRPAAGFDRIARPYRALEMLAFGRDLERARFSLLGSLAVCRDILLLGEGDGRCSERLADLAPGARITCVDSSPGMIARASARTARFGGRVSFVLADARAYAPPTGAFDGIATLFFLDCFTAPEVRSIVDAAGKGLRPGARWLFADFSLPKSGAARLRARAWLTLLYACFRWETGIGARELPPSEDILRDAGWSPLETRVLQRGLLRSVLFLPATAAPGAST